MYYHSSVKPGPFAQVILGFYRDIYEQVSDWYNLKDYQESPKPVTGRLSNLPGSFKPRLATERGTVICVLMVADFFGGDMNKERTVIRFTLNERIQHIVAMIAFILLFVSGFALKYSDTSAGQVLIRLMGGMDSRSAIHYAGGLLLIGVGIYHILYMVLTARGRDQLSRLLFRASDWKAICLSVRHLFSSERPAVPQGRFTTRQKLQFWLVVGGSLSMGASGLLIWFHDETMSLFSKWFWDFLFILHSHGAMLVFLVIVLWHIYDVHFRESFPMDGTWLSGKLSLERLKREHPLEFDELVASGKIGEDTDEA